MVNIWKSCGRRGRKENIEQQISSLRYNVVFEGKPIKIIIKEFRCQATMDQERYDADAEESILQTPGKHIISPFTDLVEIALYFDMESCKFIGPLSLMGLNLTKEAINGLNKFDPGTERALRDAQEISKLDKMNHVLCIYSK
jgi:hypothetical protein